MKEARALVCVAALALAAGCGGEAPGDGRVAGADTGLIAPGCADCHGDPARLVAPEAPPVDTTGQTSTTARGVGAHLSHLGSALIANGVACTECHVVPTTLVHANGLTELMFGTVSMYGGATPTWNRATLTCATTYCHGATLLGGTATSPVWNRVDGTQKTCGSCHGSPPPSVVHASVTSCDPCHAGYTATTVNPAAHLNGVIDVAGTGASCTDCHGIPPATAVHASVTSCEPCHAGYTPTTVDPALHLNGVVDVAGGEPPPPPPPPPPASFTLDVTTAGSGKGTVTGAAISCTTGSTVGCSAEIASTTPATSVTLLALPAKGSAFAGFTGCDSASENACVVTLSAPRSVTATFTRSNRK